MSSPQRLLEVRDPVRLRALAHPLRLRLLRLVREHGAITGAQLAAIVAESSASVSYHLSVLARHGFLEPDPAPGATRKHKPWRTTYDAMRIVSEAGLPPSQTPEGVVLATWLHESRAQQDAFVDGSSGLAPQWQDVATFELTNLDLTAAQLESMGAEIGAVLERYRSPADNDSAESARFSVSFVAVPTGPVPTGPVPTGPVPTGPVAAGQRAGDEPTA